MENEGFDINEIDPGVRELVQFLRDAGLNTTDSGDGSKHGTVEGALDFPHVIIRSENRWSVVSDSEIAHRVMVRNDYVLDPASGWIIEACYSPVDEIALVKITRPSAKAAVPTFDLGRFEVEQIGLYKDGDREVHGVSLASIDLGVPSNPGVPPQRIARISGSVPLSKNRAREVGAHIFGHVRLLLEVLPEVPMLDSSLPPDTEPGHVSDPDAYAAAVQAGRITPIPAAFEDDTPPGI